VRASQPTYHDIRGLLKDHPSIRRIAFATGAGSARIFKGAWREWLTTPGQFCAAPDRASLAVFGNLVGSGAHVRPRGRLCATEGAEQIAGGGQPIELVVLESVSPAAVPAVATKSHTKRVAAYQSDGRTDLVERGAPRASAYAWKRARWFEACFADVLHPSAAAALPFGCRESDFEQED
jgi:hypothetical protein